jgi:UDP-3-O-[3-hydroxymyristoyl] glucosamine N-acyltransferase
MHHRSTRTPPARNAMKVPNRHQAICIPAGQIAEWLGIKLSPMDREAVVTGFASLRDAQNGDLSFLSQTRYRPQLAATEASVVLVPVAWTDIPASIIALPVPDPSSAFAKIVEKYSLPLAPVRRGVHPTAVIGDGVEADLSRISVGAHAVIEAGACLEDYVEVGSGCYVGQGVRIGRGSRLFPNVTVLEGCILGANVILHSGTVIGADGFGYEFIEGRHRKIRQAGIVQIDNDVEIGANSTVDRARFGRTWIGEGTKIDNQVQIAHNVIIGKHCIVVAGVGIAGSAQIGDYVVIAAQAGVAGHLEVGSGCTIGARSGVTKSLPPGRATYLGFPAAPAAEERRRLAASRQVPDLIRRVKKLEQKDPDSAAQG